MLAVGLLRTNLGGKGSLETSHLGDHMSFIVQVQENSQGIRSASSIAPPEVFCRMPVTALLSSISQAGSQISIVRLGSTSGL